MIVCKVYVDVIDGEECIITELAKRNIPIGPRGAITNITDEDEDNADFQCVYVYPSTYVAISKEAKELLHMLVEDKANRKENVFLADYLFEVDSEQDYDNKIGAFGFLPDEETGNSQRKKIHFYKRRAVYVDAYNARTYILDTMPVYDNEFLKNLDLTEPAE